MTDTASGVVAGQTAGLDLRHRQHAPIEDRIRQAKAPAARSRFSATGSFTSLPASPTADARSGSASTHLELDLGEDARRGQAAVATMSA
jgi:hypothetical protein